VPTPVGIVPARSIIFFTYGNGKQVIAHRFNGGRENSYVHPCAARHRMHRHWHRDEPDLGRQNTPAALCRRRLEGKGSNDGCAGGAKVVVRWQGRRLFDDSADCARGGHPQVL
jgi:hypothetical protein